MLVIVLIVGGIFFYQTVLAQVSIGISPLVFEITASPGEVIENYLKVYNSSADEIVIIKMEVEDIAPTGETGHVTVEPAETESYSIARWVNVELKEFELQPREEKFVKFIIQVPENAEPGGHYGTVLASTKAVAGPRATGATIIQRIGSLVLITIPGVMEENLIVKDFTAPHYSEYGPIPFEIGMHLAIVCRRV